MLTVRAAAQLLAAADSLDALAPIAAELGFAPNAAPLDGDTRRALGLDDAIVDARVATGRGALRALLLGVRADAALSTLLPRIAASLASRAPHVLWIVLAVQPESASVALAAWTDDRRPPRVAALVADRGRIVDSDADTLRALSTAASDRDVLTHTRWVEILGRDALTGRFYRALERAVSTIAQSSTAKNDDVRRELALLDTSRLLFLSFLEAKGWLDGDRAFLLHHFERCMSAGGQFHHRVLRPLFFGTLNTPIRRRAGAARAFGHVPFLNGGLFARTPVERMARGATFSDDAYGALLYDVFAQFRFTAREESAAWNEAAIDPEMLGKAFESLMASSERLRTGAFFTPFALVARVADAGLDMLLDERPSLALDGVAQLTVLDPACGSGAFLVHALERIADLHVRLGDARDLGAIRRDVLTRSIFGVDVNPTAVWLCELRLWLSVVIESAAAAPADVAPLPNLDRNVRVGDALSARAFGDGLARSRDAAVGRGVLRLRERYTRATGPRKVSLARALDRAERARAMSAIDDELASLRERRRDVVAAQRGRDLFGERRVPSASERRTAAEWRQRAAALRRAKDRIQSGGALAFSFDVHFADVAARGGFGLVVGNPPWVRLHRVGMAARAIFRRDYEVARDAAWSSGAARAGAARGFAGQVDVAALFVERSLRLLAPGGALALLVPAKLWCSLAGGGIRRLITSEARVRRIEDYSEALTAFDAAVYPSLIVAERPRFVDGDGSPAVEPAIRVAVSRAGNTTLAWQHAASIAFDDSPGAPWLLLPPDPRRAFDRLMRGGQPLGDSPIGRPRLGVKCGCNEAFVVRPVDPCEFTNDLAQVRGADGGRATIERALLRPLIRGEHLQPWRAAPGDETIIWTHDDRGAPLARLPKHAAIWMARWRRSLAARADARQSARWWTLFRTDAARTGQARVVWGDLGREPRASVLDVGDVRVPLNSCYIAHCRDLADADLLAAVLNGPIARAWLNALAEPARGGYRRYFGWTLALLPMPRDWSRARELLSPLGARARLGDVPGDEALLEATIAAYGVAHADVAPLVAWMCS